MCKKGTFVGNLHWKEQEKRWFAQRGCFGPKLVTWGGGKGSSLKKSVLDLKRREGKGR